MRVIAVMTWVLRTVVMIRARMWSIAKVVLVVMVVVVVVVRMLLSVLTLEFLCISLRVWGA